jgi:hypothetical protein
MSPLIGLAVAIAVASPAAADWATRERYGEYQAGKAAEGGAGNIVISCYPAYHDRRFVAVYTGERYDPESSYAPEVPISVITDGRQQPIVNGSFDKKSGLDGEKLIVKSDTSISGTLARVLDAMSASKSTIDVQFYQREYRFSPKGLAAGLRFLNEKCP